ncbi:uncharacterized protein [Argopecten irradians]|uniref:uncharacterized protein n=1 Tax=Argopecten irradians TaxID=31199 RepID=UPI00371CE006
MARNLNTETNGFLVQGSKAGAKYPPDVTTKTLHPALIRYKIGTVLAACLFIAESWFVMYTVKHFLIERDTGRHSTTNDYNIPPAMSVVSTETCNKTSSCSVIRQGGYVSLIKLMHGIKSQSRILKRGSSPLKSPLRMKCDNFIISCCRKGQLKWIHDSYIQEQELNGSVTIKASGLYGLYNTLSFENGHHHNTNKLEVLHQVRLDKSLGHQSKVLLERNITLFAQNRSYDTSDFFDFVFLRKGDRVYPTISNTSFLNSMSGANMWGVFQVTLDPRLI